MKILTANFLTCAVKACKSSPKSFPLHFKDAELEQVEMEYNPTFVKNILPRVEWEALRTTAAELGFTNLPAEKPEPPADAPESDPAAAPGPPPPDAPPQDDAEMVTEATSTVAGGPPATGADDDKLWRDLHTLLLETQVVEGKMVCGNCGHEYRIKEGIANFLLPNHLV